MKWLTDNHGPYEIIEEKKLTCPIPSAIKIRAAYGKVISGNIIDDTVRIRLYK